MDWKLLEIYLDGHYGFGSYAADVWLVGPGSRLHGMGRKHIEQRIAAWHRRGQREMDDLYSFHAASGDVDRFTANPRIDRTWSRLSRFVLASRGETVLEDSVRSYQAEVLGRQSERDACLVNLMAVNPVTTPWPFGHSPLSYLSNPDRFVDQFLARRTRHIRSRVRRHKPGLVIFYDRTHTDVWMNIAGVTFTPTELSGCHAARSSNTLFMLLRHPESVGTTNRYFERAGEMVANLKASKTLSEESIV
ncbi:MAG: hypothetical protein KJO98_02695 [Rhodothermia bacterium]|nr:hypothetical protein [Rhodothermia bacterium]